MAWNTPPSFVTLTTLTAANMVIMTGNDTYLYNGRPVQYVTRNAAYSSTATTFTDIDATNLIITATLAGTRARVLFQIATNCPAVGGSVAVIMDSATYPANHNATYGLLPIPASVGVGFALFTGLTPGSHTFKLQWKAPVANTISNTGVGAPFETVYMELEEF